MGRWPGRAARAPGAGQTAPGAESREPRWLAWAAYRPDVCAAVGGARMAALVCPELGPLSGANVMIGHGVACYGAADRYLGILAATLGEHEAAEGHFAAALSLN